MSDPTTQQGQYGYIITIKDVYDQLSVVAERLGEMVVHMQSIDTRNSAADALHVDHESRLRKLEAWRYAITVNSLLALSGVIIAVMSLVLHHGTTP